MKEQAKQKYAELQKEKSNLQMSGGSSQQEFERSQPSQQTPNNVPPQNAQPANQTTANQTLPPSLPVAAQPLPPGQPEMHSPNPPQQNGTGGGIYGDYMEHLIQMALADGELTEKEKQVLFKKAEAHGIDLDEFEMVLDARLYERQKAMQAAAPMAHDSAPKSEKYGDVRKCPACGAIVESFTTRCPDCGHEFTNIGAVSSVTALFKKLEALESQRKENNSLIKGYYGGLLFGEKIEKQKVNLIQTFPVPTTKEDILEFLAMAASQAEIPKFYNKRPNQDYVPHAWWNKCKQIIIKARLSMKDDKKIMEEIEEYARQLKIS